MESGEVDGGGLVVSGGQTAPLLDLVDAPFDRVPLLVGVAVEGWRTTAAPAEPLAVRGPVSRAELEREGRSTPEAGPAM